mgnify:CR=1 FL=1
MNLDTKFEKLVKGQAQYKSSNLGCNLLISRLQRKFSDNCSQEVLKGCIQEMNAFFTKYQNVTKNDIDEISKL